MAMLEHRIPPPLIALSCAGIAWGLAHYSAGLDVAIPGRVAAVALLVVLGMALDLTALLAFRNARTTVNPLSPGKSSAIVEAGPYRFTRNPMYLGMVVFLLAYCLYLANPVSLLAVALFIAYITRFQIIPEERFLREKFGAPYDAYLARVRRWI